jgi:uncharacterized protein YfaS (alpha-2-macroglobulin family)
MKKFFLITALVWVFIITCMSQNKPVMERDMNKYAKEWATIDSLRRQGLHKSLFPKVDSVYQSALAEGNYEQVIKAVIFRINAIGLLEENDEGANKIFRELKADAGRLPQPSQSIVYSILGQMYEDFYGRNAWTINSRTNMTGDLENIHTWDARKLVEEALTYYDLSLRDAEALQREPVDRYKEILRSGYDPVCQPTLYDLLANRALAFYASEFNVSALSRQTFVANDPDYFADAQTFSTLSIRSDDTLSPVYLSLKTYQKLLRFHLDRSNFDSSFGKANDDVTALIEVDLRRMTYLKNKGRYADPDRMYEKALTGMSEFYKSYGGNAGVLLQLGGFYLDQGAKWRENKMEEYKSGYADAFKIYERIKQEYPDRLSVNAEALKENVLCRELELEFEVVQLPGKPFLALLKYRNTDTLHIATYRLTKEQVLDYTYNLDRYKRRKYYRFPEFLQTLRVAPSKKQLRLPAQADHQYYTTEIKIGPYEKGFYLITVSDSDDPAASASVYQSFLLQVSSLAAQHRMVDQAMTVLVTDRETGKPVPGAKVATCKIEEDKHRIVNTFTSDHDGVARSEKIPGNYRSELYTVETSDDHLMMFGFDYNRDVHERPDHNQAVLFTDRSIYRPGQTVYFKAILYNGDGGEPRKLLKGTTVRVCLRDVNRQIVSEQSLTSNDFGSFDGSFTIPQGLLNGNMTIECPGYASTGIRVEEYKRPTFEVKFDPLEGAPALNGPVKVTAKAKALAGYAIDHAEVRYRVVRNTHYRHYYGWYPPINDDREISSGVVKTDEQGRFTVEFTALADDVASDRIYTYTLTADVTDVNGETRSASLPVNAGSKPLLITTNLPDEIQLGKTGACTVETTNLNGDAVPASVKVKIIALKAPGKILRKRVWYDRTDVQTIPEDEFRKNFPSDAYGDELNPDQRKELKTVAEYTLATPDDQQLDLSSMKRSGYYKIRLTADNGRGLVVEETRYVYLSSGEPETIPDMQHWLTVVKNEGEPGEQAEFQLAGGRKESYVYCEWIHKDRIVDSKWVKTGTKPVRLTYPIREEHRGGFLVQLSMVQDNRIYVSSNPVNVPYTNKMLDIQLATFRDKLLPGEQETWTLSVSDKKGEKETAEIVASLYDASLDAIQPRDWPDFSTLYRSFLNTYIYHWETSLQNLSYPLIHKAVSPDSWQYTVPLADINWFGAVYRNVFSTNTFAYGRSMLRSARINLAEDEDRMFSSEDVAETSIAFGEIESVSVVAKQVGVTAAENRPPAAPSPLQKKILSTGSETSETDPALIETRTNFNETAFFYPKLRTNEQGATLIEFTMPEALTRWKLLSFAHTKDLKAGTYSNELITQKQVAISANVPRFFRENDVIELTAKVNNLTESSLDGRALLRLYDAVTLEPLDDEMIQSEKTLPFGVKAGESAALRWTLAIPAAGIQAVVCKVTAQAGTHTDGEEKTIPVLTNSMLVTETLPFSVRAGQAKTFTLDRLVDRPSATLRHHSLTLEFTSAPAWYAVQALPYIMEYPYECAEQTFSRYYANTLATSIVNRTPRIKQIFELWNAPDSKALMSNLEKNQELKQVMLEETPWVMQAKDDAERKKRIGLLFDLNRMSSEQNRAFNRLKKIRNSDGGIPWFDGLPSSRYITQYIVAGMAHLKKMNAMQPENLPGADEIVQEGLRYLDFEIRKDYESLIRNNAKMKERQISSLQLHYLYACSFNNHQPDERTKTAFDYYLKQAGEYWTEFSTYDKAMTVLILHRNNQPDRALAILRSLKETAQQSETLGMYWKDNVAGYFWHQAPIETQAMLIEAFHEAANDAASVEEMKIWLLRNKQTNDWKTTKATSEAIYALLMTGGKLLNESKLPEIEIGGTSLAKAAKEAIHPEPGTGYVKTSWSAGDITPRMGKLKVRNPNNQGIMWGGLYWQYFEQLDKITSAETNLQMNKRLYLRTLTENGEHLQPIDETHQLRVGDLVRVRMELKADRDYEYVHLKDMRASAFEPVSTRSGCRYQDGLWYYENVKDASTNFFITHLHKGIYVFEYDLRVSHAGDFSNGITTFQCMYAPEFTSHSEGIRLKISASE